MLESFVALALKLTKETRKNPKCISYTFNQRSDDPVEFVLYEQWVDESALEAHIQNLKLTLGPSRPGDVIPKKLMEMYESAEPVFYEIIE